MNPRLLNLAVCAAVLTVGVLSVGKAADVPAPVSAVSVDAVPQAASPAAKPADKAQKVKATKAEATKDDKSAPAAAAKELKDAKATNATGNSDVGVGFDASKPIDVNADNFAADLKRSIGTYSGNVIVVQGMLKMHADQVVVNAPEGKASHLEAHGHVVIVSPSGTATGENGVYEVGSRVMHLMGNVVLTKEQSVMRGSQVDMQVATGEAHLIASPGTIGADGQTKPGRVQGLFIPADKPDDAAKAPKSGAKP